MAPNRSVKTCTWIQTDWVTQIWFEQETRICVAVIAHPKVEPLIREASLCRVGKKVSALFRLIILTFWLEVLVFANCMFVILWILAEPQKRLF